MIILDLLREKYIKSYFFAEMQESSKTQNNFTGIYDYTFRLLILVIELI